jgi:hypothetical protein
MLNNIIVNIKAASLILLNVNALNADLNVPALVDQKLINKNDVKPINSQPNNIINILPASTNKVILQTKELSNIINLSILGSYLK